MGGHGGLNILPQKRWNVYNRDNKAKVEKDQQKQHEKNEQINKNLNEGQASARYEFLKRKKNSKNLENRTIQKSEISKKLLGISCYSKVFRQRIGGFDEEQTFEFISK